MNNIDVDIKGLIFLPNRNIRLKHFTTIEETKNILENYYDIPDISVIFNLLYYFTWLNHYAKYSLFPISKSAFYNLKNKFITYLININHPDVHWEIKPYIEYQKLSENKCNYFVIITFKIADKPREFTFHQKIENNFLGRCIYEDIKDLPLKEYVYKPNIIDYQNAIVLASSVIDTWKKVYDILENNNWFIFNYLTTVSWVDTINSIYPKFGIKTKQKLWKLPVYAPNTALSIKHIKKNGEIITVSFRALQWRKNLYLHLKEFKHLGEYNLKIKDEISPDTVIS